MSGSRGAAEEGYSAAYAARHGSFVLVPAAYVLLRRGDEVLLQLRRRTGYYDEHWAFGAAGHVEAGESVVEAALREAAEEIGVRIASADLEPLTAMHRTATSATIDQRIDLFFQTRSWSGEPALQEDTASDLRWFALDALPEKVVPHERFVLDALRDGGLPAVVSYGFPPRDSA
ncbi:NUDIX domain-containing protein [Rathayibacter sp. YIM 133350]|uniref:NUDIX domain-containing protein n=1 Tax=Rathayibacter sp. YIM 133350 TaxID=3131992 RepID=UPI00307DF170